MLSKDLGFLVACAALAAVSLTLSTVSAAQGPSASTPAAVSAPPPPVVPPSLPPSSVVNLMTPEGIAAFGTQWKNMDAKIVDGPAMPGAGGQMENGVRHPAACRRKRLRRFIVADNRGQSAGRTARRRQGVLHLVPHEPDAVRGTL